MSAELQLLEATADEVEEQCPVCEHLWSSQSESHYHDCPFFALEAEDENDEDLGAELGAMHIESIGIML